MEIQFMRLADQPRLALKRAAEELAKHPANPSEREIYHQLVAAVWRGAFEDEGGTYLSLPSPKTANARGEALADAADDSGKPIRTPPIGEGEAELDKTRPALSTLRLPTTDPPHRPIDRATLRRALAAFGDLPQEIGNASFTTLANLPIERYEGTFRSAYLDVLAAEAAALLAWCKAEGFALPDSLADDATGTVGRLAVKRDAGRPPAQQSNAKQAISCLYPGGVPRGVKRESLTQEVNDWLARNGKPAVSSDTIDRVLGRRR